MQVIQYRRALHRIPELDRDLPETLSYLRGILSPLSCTLSSPIPGALCAFFDFGRPDAIAFRSDADALPITERTGLPFTSGGMAGPADRPAPQRPAPVSAGGGDHRRRQGPVPERRAGGP